MPKIKINYNTIKIKYQKIYNLFFKQAIYLIIITIGIITIISVFSEKKILDKNDNFMIEKAKLVGEFNKKLNQEINSKDIKIYITNGTLDSKKDLLISINNLVSYKGFILPRNVFIYQTNKIEDINYFNKNDYDIKELENIARNIIFTNLDTIDKSSTQNISLPIVENIENTFYIQCIKQNKIFTKTCDYYTKNFLNTFFIYNINNDYGGIKRIFNLLSKTKYKKDFCEGIKKYILYSNDTNNELEMIFQKCGNEYLQTFKDLKIFIEIQDQLNNGYINSSIYENPTLNNYKLISFQQIIYNDLHQNTIDNIRFESYSNYLINILKDNGKIDNIYLDLTYRFNNNYLINVLNKNKYKVSERKKTEIENIIKDLNTINNGSNLEGYKGLRKSLTNNDLQKSYKSEDLLEYSELSEIGILLKKLKSLSFLKIINEKASDEKIKISGYFSIKIKDGFIPLYLGFIIDKDGFVENININKYLDINDTVGNIIKHKKYTITEIYQYIQNNINIFLSSDIISTCELIKNRIENYKNNNKQINYIELTNCDQENINIIKQEEKNKETIKLFYKIKLNNFNILDIQISDKDLENEILEYLNNINTNNITIPNIIEQIMSYQKKHISTKQEGSNKIIIAIEDFQKYLSIVPKDISESDGEISIEFSIKSIDFIGSYNIENKTISNLYFKYNIQNDKDLENKLRQSDLLIKDLNIILNDNNENGINNFLINPLDYIKKIDPISITNYERLKYR